jgi:hypothetical protein
MQMEEWSASRPGRFNPGERVPGTDWIGGWVDPRVGLDDVEKRKFLTLPHSNSNPSVVQPIASRYTDYAIAVIEKFQFIYFFQPHYGPGVHSACNRSEYQESSWGVKGGGLVRLTTSQPSVSLLSRLEDVGASTSHNPMGLHGLLQGQLYRLL